MSRPVWAALAAAIVAGVLLRWPVLSTGLRADDFVQWAMLDGNFVLQRAPWDLFWFGAESAQEERALMDFGYHPWWSMPGLRLSMFRPLSSLLVAFDVRVLQSSVGAHAHSLLWWALLMLASALLFSRLFGAAVAATAVLLFAIEEAHGAPLSWLANRSTLVSTSLGVLALWAHIRARGHDWQPGRLLAPLLMALALAAGEYALTAFAYLLSYELLARQDAPTVRLRAALPCLSAALLYLLLRASLGYGVQGSGFYISPTAEPLTFLSAAAVRIPVLSADLTLGIPANWWMHGTPWRGMLLEAELFTAETWRSLPGWHTWHWLIGVAAMLMVWLWLRWARRHRPDDYQQLRWLALGALLSLVPASGSLPSHRLLAAGALFASALTAVILVHCAGALGRAGQQGRWGRMLALVVTLALVSFFQVAQAAKRSQGFARGFRYRVNTTAAWSLGAEIPAQQNDLRLLIVHAADFTTAANLPWVRLNFGHPLPRYYRRLSGAHQAHDVERTADNALVVRAVSGPLSDSAAGTLYRSSDAHFQVGHRVELPDMQVEVLRVIEGNPASTRFTFDNSLDDPRYILLHSSPEGLVRVPLPPVGEKVRLPRGSYPRPLR